jgi:hypothetical protein
MAKPFTEQTLNEGDFHMNSKVTKLVGVTDRRVQGHIRTFGNPDFPTYILIREPDNPHDPNAIKVTIAGVIFLGYLAREIASELAPLMDEGTQFDAFFVNLNKHPIHKTVGLTIRIEESCSKKKAQGVAGECSAGEKGM